jgi:hypothetical protein
MPWGNWRRPRLRVEIIHLICHRIGKNLNLQIQDELGERRRKFAAA